MQTSNLWPQTTQLTSGVDVTAVLENCCANCVKTSRPYEWGTDFPGVLPSWPAIRAPRWLALLPIKAGDVETNPGPTTTRKQVWICDI